MRDACMSGAQVETRVCVGVIGMEILRNAESHMWISY